MENNPKEIQMIYASPYYKTSLPNKKIKIKLKALESQW